MKELKQVSFPFKGNRDYIQGTSVFNAIVTFSQQIGIKQGTIDINFKAMIESPNCVIELRAAQSDDAVSANISCAQSGKKISLVVNPSSITSPMHRVKYDETNICKNSDVSELTISQKNLSHEDRIELVVALCKKLHIETIDHNKKWIFSRYKGEFPILIDKELRLNVVKRVGTRLTCSDVLADNKKIAQIFFS